MQVIKSIVAHATGNQRSGRK